MEERKMEGNGKKINKERKKNWKEGKKKKRKELKGR